MKTSDIRILQHIRQNARINLTTLSRKTGVPVSTLFDKLRNQEGKIITKFTALLDFTMLGYPVRMKVFLKATPERRLELKNFLLAHTRVNDLWRINNGYDYTADCVFRDLKEAEEFLEGLEVQFGVLECQAYHVIDDLAREKVLAGELTLDI